MSSAGQPEPASIVVRSCKYDGRVARSWAARVARREGSLIVLDAAFAEEVRHPLLGVIRAGTLSTEMYWADRWYSVFRFAEPSGELRNFYCNVNTPPVIGGGALTYVDLDIDILVAPDLSYRVLDEDEFEAHARQYGYPPGVRDQARRAVEELVGLITRREFPFGPSG